MVVKTDQSCAHKEPMCVQGWQPLPGIWGGILPAGEQWRQDKTTGCMSPHSRQPDGPGPAQTRVGASRRWKHPSAFLAGDPLKCTRFTCFYGNWCFLPPEAFQRAVAREWQGFLRSSWILLACHQVI